MWLLPFVLSFQFLCPNLFISSPDDCSSPAIKASVLSTKYILVFRSIGCSLLQLNVRANIGVAINRFLPDLLIDTGRTNCCWPATTTTVAALLVPCYYYCCCPAVLLLLPSSNPKEPIAATLHKQGGSLEDRYRAGSNNWRTIRGGPFVCCRQKLPKERYGLQHSGWKQPVRAASRRTFPLIVLKTGM